MNSGGWSGCAIVAGRLRSLYMSSVGISPRVCSGCVLTALEGSTQQEPSPGVPALFSCATIAYLPILSCCFEKTCWKASKGPERTGGQNHKLQWGKQTQRCPRSQRAGFQQGNRVGGPAVSSALRVRMVLIGTIRQAPDSC